MQIKLNPLINPQKVAIIGASATRMNPGKILLQKYAPHCDVTAIALQSIDGYKTVDTVAKLPEKQDLVIIAVNKDKVREILKEIENGDKARSVQIITSGFEEMGDLQLNKLLNNARIPIQGTNCVGNVSQGRDFTFLPGTRALKTLHQESLCGSAYKCNHDCSNCDVTENQETHENNDSEQVTGVVSASGAFLT